MKDCPKDDAAPVNAERVGMGCRGFMALTTAGLVMPMAFSVTGGTARRRPQRRRR